MGEEERIEEERIEDPIRGRGHLHICPACSSEREMPCYYKCYCTVKALNKLCEKHTNCDIR